MVKIQERDPKKSGAVVVAAFLGGFVSRHLDKSFEMGFPSNVIYLASAAIIFFIIIYFSIGRWL